MLGTFGCQKQANKRDLQDGLDLPFVVVVAAAKAGDLLLAGSVTDFEVVVVAVEVMISRPVLQPNHTVGLPHVVTAMVEVFKGPVVIVVPIAIVTIASDLLLVRNGGLVIAVGVEVLLAGLMFQSDHIANAHILASVLAVSVCRLDNPDVVGIFASKASNLLLVASFAVVEIVRVEAVSRSDVLDLDFHTIADDLYVVGKVYC